MHMMVTTCPHCGKVNDCHSDGRGGVPGAGDVSMCFGCGQPAIYVLAGGALELRKPTESERAELEAVPEIFAAQAVLRGIAEERP